MGCSASGVPQDLAEEREDGSTDRSVLANGRRFLAVFADGDAPFQRFDPLLAPEGHSRPGHDRRAPSADRGMGLPAQTPPVAVEESTSSRSLPSYWFSNLGYRPGLDSPLTPM